ncbi:alpha/beta hydrolase [Patescibacteria group bacterium]|nr:alpha/beta hydrolase [Patescibacteria group bacterium]
MREETVEIHGTRVNYKIAGEGPLSPGVSDGQRKPVLILHGWGKGLVSWEEVQGKIAEKGWKVITVDLPGFGKTSAPTEVWGIEEYTDFVLEFAEKLGLGKWILLGHSFGGQIAVNLAVKHPERIQKLILCAPVAIRREPGLRENIIQYVAKAGSFVLFLVPVEGLRQLARKLFARSIGRNDYLEAHGVMRKIMQKVIREDLSSAFSQIKTPTLLIWGDKDRAVPVGDAYIMKEQIPNASLEVLVGIGHRVHREVPDKLAEATHRYISSHT